MKKCNIAFILTFLITLTVFGISFAHADVIPLPDDPIPDDAGSSLSDFLPLIFTVLLILAVELIVAVIFFKRWKIDKKKWNKPLLTIVIANIISVPLMWIVFFAALDIFIGFSEWGILFAMAIAEIVAIGFIGGALYYFNKKLFSKKKAFILSAIMNIAGIIIAGIALIIILAL